MLSSTLMDYVELHTTPEPPVLQKLNRETHLNQVSPQMMSGHVQGMFLRMMVQMLRPERILEIGTFTGYSAISMGLGMTLSTPLPPKGKRSPLLHTIEVNPELEEGIRKGIFEAGLEQQVVLHIGPALKVIPEIDEKWDLVFIDADKPNYLRYYQMVLPLVNPGGFIVADNVLWDGKVTGNNLKMDKDTRGIVDFNDFVHGDTQVENLMLPVRDGLMIIRKKS